HCQGGDLGIVKGGARLIGRRLNGVHGQHEHLARLLLFHHLWSLRMANKTACAGFETSKTRRRPEGSCTVGKLLGPLMRKRFPSLLREKGQSKLPAQRSRAGT